MTNAHIVQRLLAMALWATFCSPVSAQDFLVAYGREGPPPEFESEGPLLIRVGDRSSTVVRRATAGSVRCGGSRYSLFSGFDRGSETERLYYYDLRAGVTGMVPDIVLERHVEQGLFWTDPGLVADDLSSRVFIWHGRRVSVFDCATREFRDLLTADASTDTPFGTFPRDRRLAFAPEANLLFVGRTNPDDRTTLETAVVDVTTRAVVRRIPAWAPFMSVNRAGTRLLFSDPYRGFDDQLGPLQLVDVSSGAIQRVPRPHDFVTHRSAENKPGPPVLDEVRERIILPVQGGFHVLDFQLSVVASFAAPELTTGAFVSRATGRTLLNWTGVKHSYYSPWPGPCYWAVLRPDDSLARVDALATLGGSERWGCTSVVLSVPARPTALSATVAGQRATLTWANPDDVSGFEVEVGTAPGRTDLRIPLRTVTSLSVDNVPAGTYFVRVRGINELGPGVPSDTLTVVVR